METVESSARESLRGVEEVLREAEAPPNETPRQNDKRDTKPDTDIGRGGTPSPIRS